ncbi:hypothetical protein OROMI_029227 [Orobanche minor]
MASKIFNARGLDFVSNNYAAPLNSDDVPEDFHLFQRFFINFEIGHALTAPDRLSGSQITAFWKTGEYLYGGENESPSIIFEFDDQESVITPVTVRDALGLQHHTSYAISIGDALLQNMKQSIGYDGPLTKIGQLKRPHLRKEWSLFFDCITRTFSKKCPNWDAIPIDSLQIGYSLLNGTHFDFSRLVLDNIGEKMTENGGTVYFARFCQLIFNACIPDLAISEDDVIPSFKRHKRVFTDLSNKDRKKINLCPLYLPVTLKQFQEQPQPQEPVIQASQPPLTQPQPPNTETQPQSSHSINPEPPIISEPQPLPITKPKTSGRIKRKAVKASIEDEAEALRLKRRRLIIEESEDEFELTVLEAPEVISKEVPAVETSPITAEHVVEGSEEFKGMADFEPNVPLFDDLGAQNTFILDEYMATHIELCSVHALI